MIIVKFGKFEMRIAYFFLNTFPGKTIAACGLIMSISACLLGQNNTKTQPPKTAEFAPYSELIPGTKISFDMVPIQGGEYLMGSPATEASRREMKDLSTK